MATTNEPLADVPDKSETPPPDDKGAHPKHRHSLLYWLIFALIVVAAAIIVIFAAWLPRHRQKQEIERQAKQQQQILPRVRVLKVKTAAAESELMVPGTTQAYTEANIYARASGYVSRRLVDIGDRVRAGQLMAVIDAPDLDRQVAQARSNLRQSESNLIQMQAQLHLNSLNWDRYKVLVAKGVFSRQEGDTQEANFRVADANVHASENALQANRENLERLLVLQAYERVTAPFTGIVTARNIDVGTLITAQGTGVPESSATLPGTTQSGAEGNNAGSSGNVSSSAAPATGGSQGGAMFTVADTSILRVLVSIPEVYTSVVKIGQQANLLFQEVPGEKFAGRVTRTSASIDQNTRTLLVEVQVRNHHSSLMPGMYAQVNLIQSKSVPPILIPGEAIVVRNAQNVVALVENQVVHLHPVAIGRDYGDQVEITSGLKSGDLVALDVTDEVRNGARIQPQFTQEKSQAPGGQTNQQPNNGGQYGNQNATNQSREKASGTKSKSSNQTNGKGSSSKPAKQ